MSITGPIRNFRNKQEYDNLVNVSNERVKLQADNNKGYLKSFSRQQLGLPLMINPDQEDKRSDVEKKLSNLLPRDQINSALQYLISHQEIPTYRLHQKAFENYLNGRVFDNSGEFINNWKIYLKVQNKGGVQKQLDDLLVELKRIDKTLNSENLKAQERAQLKERRNYIENQLHEQLQNQQYAAKHKESSEYVGMRQLEEIFYRDQDRFNLIFLDALKNQGLEYDPDVNGIPIVASGKHLIVAIQDDEPYLFDRNSGKQLESGVQRKLMEKFILNEKNALEKITNIKDHIANFRKNNIHEEKSVDEPMELSLAMEATPERGSERSMSIGSPFSERSLSLSEEKSFRSEMRRSGKTLYVRPEGDEIPLIARLPQAEKLTVLQRGQIKEYLDDVEYDLENTYNPEEYRENLVALEIDLAENLQNTQDPHSEAFLNRTNRIITSIINPKTILKEIMQIVKEQKKLAQPDKNLLQNLKQKLNNVLPTKHIDQENQNKTIRDINEILSRAAGLRKYSKAIKPKKALTLRQAIIDGEILAGNTNKKLLEESKRLKKFINF